MVEGFNDRMNPNDGSLNYKVDTNYADPRIVDMEIHCVIMSQYVRVREVISLGGRRRARDLKTNNYFFPNILYCYSLLQYANIFRGRIQWYQVISKVLGTSDILLLC